MRLCQPYLRALGRSFAVSSLLAGVIAVLGAAALAALARLCDTLLSNPDGRDCVPLAALAAMAIAGAVLVHLARATLVNRRKIWLRHGLSETVLAHELWLGSENRHRNRSLAAVAQIAHFSGSGAALAAAEAPWAMALLGALWFADLNLAAIANAAALSLLAMALWGSRLTSQATQFDTAFDAVCMGHDAIQTAALGRDASHDHARAVAAHWETTQRGAVANGYAAAQRAVRRRLVANLMFAAASVAVITMAATAAVQGTVSGGEALALGCATLCALGVLLRWAKRATDAAAARAALRHLATLRVARNRQGGARLPMMAPPDLRGPAVLAVLGPLITAAGLAAGVIFWQVPVTLQNVQQLSLAKPAKAGVMTTTIPTATAAPESLDLRATLSGYQSRLDDLKREALTLSTGAQPETGNRAAEIEAEQTRLAAQINTTLERLARLQLQQAPSRAAVPASSPTAQSDRKDRT